MKGGKSRTGAYSKSSPIDKEEVEEGEIEETTDEEIDNEAIDELTSILGDEVTAGDDPLYQADSDEEENLFPQETIDPVKIYLREMGAVSLLNAKQEVELAKQIEKAKGWPRAASSTPTSP
jgi:RNA polymerase primary sigma factor